MCLVPGMFCNPVPGACQPRFPDDAVPFCFSITGNTGALQREGTGPADAGCPCMTAVSPARQQAPAPGPARYPAISRGIKKCRCPPFSLARGRQSGDSLDAPLPELLKSGGPEADLRRPDRGGDGAPGGRELKPRLRLFCAGLPG